jgi:hypothetical protein
MNRLHGYQLGSFIAEVDRCNETNNIVAVLRAVEKFLPAARDIEQAIFESIKEADRIGKAGSGVTEVTVGDPLHLSGHKTMSMRLIPD